MNRYFILSLENINKESLNDIIVGEIYNQRVNKYLTKIMVKLPYDDKTKHSLLKDYIEYNHEQILIELLKDEWNEKL